MDDLNKFSNLQATMKNMSALQNLAIGTAAMQSPLNNSPELVKNMQMAQKFMSSPAYQAMVKQQEILSKISIPESLMAEFQAANNFIQPLTQNENFARLNEIAQFRNFLSSALAVQDAAIDFLSEMKKIDGYEQKNLVELLKEIRLKKNGEIEIPEDLTIEEQEDFLTIKEIFKKHFDKNKDSMLGILSNANSAVTAVQNFDISNVLNLIAFVIYIVNYFKDIFDDDK